jgi:hypothetical protein
MFEKDGESYLCRPMNAGRFDVLRYQKYDYTPSDIQTLSERIHESIGKRFLSRAYLKKYPNAKYQSGLAGLCVPASFVFMYLLDTDRLSPFRSLDSRCDMHWWIEDRIDGRRFDLTSSQYSQEECENLYQTGKKSRLYSFRGIPQSRFLDLMSLVAEKSVRYQTTDPVGDSPINLTEFFV